MTDMFPAAWRSFLDGTVDFSRVEAILREVGSERLRGAVYPPEGRIFCALERTPPEKVRVVIVGQDPYHNPGEAQGLAFSVPDTVRRPPSLRNIFREFSDDLGEKMPHGNDLSAWADGGVLLLNAVLSVRENAPGSHRKLGWEYLTDGIIRAIAEKTPRTVFILWGNFAAAKKALIADEVRHRVIVSAHPSPLSAHRGFFGSRPFSQAENFLAPWKWPRIL
ncbi:MAG: uracil-DNA glycosylase [Victivallaceae bacterium]|nr:uracil-DNA glycosylase [Victivallaceae bacterium]